MFCVNERYEKLEIYHLGHELAISIYAFVETLPLSEKHILGDQLRRAVISVPLNIAEGSGAGSYRTFLNFLTFAFRSAREVQAGLVLCRDLHFVCVEEFERLHEMVLKVLCKMWRYMEYVDKKCVPRRGDGRYVRLGESIPERST